MSTYQPSVLGNRQIDLVAWHTLLKCPGVLRTCGCLLSLTKRIKVHRRTDRQISFKEVVWLAQGHRGQTSPEHSFWPPFPCPSTSPPSVLGGFQGHLHLGSRLVSPGQLRW